MTQRLGKYEIVEEIGKGGFATVYRARDPDLDREVALKVLDPVLMRDPSLVERFRREARAAARLRHPGIVTIHEIGQAEGMLFIAMELLPGPSLKAIVEESAPLPLERAVELLRPLAEALDYAHAQGLIHRDVKPSNAILDAGGHPVLTDFGLVKAAEESGSAAVSLTLSQTGMTLGTPAYMAPEQADPKAQTPVDHRADLYSLGVSAYEMLTGRVPFQGNTPLAVAMGHLLEPPPSPRELNPALPEPMAEALLRMLTKKPEGRYGSAEAFVDALAAGAVVPQPAENVVPKASVPVPAAMATRGADRPREPAPSVVGAPAPAARTVSASPRRTVPLWAWGLVGVAMLVVLGIAVVALLGGGNQPTPGSLVVKETVVVTQEVDKEGLVETTSTPGPTDAPTALPTDTPAPAPTATLTPRASDTTGLTNTMVPTTTPPDRPTGMVTPTNSPLPTPVSTTASAPTSTPATIPSATASLKSKPSPTATSTIAVVASPSLLWPPPGESVQDLVTFEWQWDLALASGQYFDIHIRRYPDKSTEYRGVSLPIKTRQITVNLQNLVDDRVHWNTWVGGPIEQGTEVWWSVALVQWNGDTQQTAKPLSESELRRCVFAGTYTGPECDCSNINCKACTKDNPCCSSCCP
jgi:tRNA A-37 threonylcarbamoyl transferase component Bud32